MKKDIIIMLQLNIKCTSKKNLQRKVEVRNIICRGQEEGRVDILMYDTESTALNMCNCSIKYLIY